MIERIRNEMESAPREGSDERVQVISISQLLDLTNDLIEHTFGAWIPARNEYVHKQLQKLLD